jgi:hypothetical protein
MIELSLCSINGLRIEVSGQYSTAECHVHDKHLLGLSKAAYIQSPTWLPVMTSRNGTFT